MKIFVEDDSGNDRLIDVAELFAAAGVTVTGTPLSDLSAENAAIRQVNERLAADNIMLTEANEGLLADIDTLTQANKRLTTELTDAIKATHEWRFSMGKISLIVDEALS